MAMQTDEELAALPEQPAKRSSPGDRIVRAEMMRVAKLDEPPPAKPGDKEYLDDLAERMKL